MACHTPHPQKSKETRGNAITQPQSHPWMGPRLDNDISWIGPGLGSGISFLRGGV